MQPETCKPNLWAASIVAFVILVAGGAGYRALAAQYAQASKSAPIPPGTLAKLPMQIGAWQGFEEPLDEHVIKATDTDDHVNRFYRRSGADSVSIFTGYGVNLRDLAPHRPDVCYPGAGWTLEETRHDELKLADGSKLPVQLYRFQKSGLSAQRVTVLNYYLVDGEYCADVSLLRKRASQGGGQAAYAAQVQIVTGAMVEQIAAAWVREFAAESAPLIRRLLADAVATSAVAPGGA